MSPLSSKNIQAARRPIESLLSKSRNAIGKLKTGTWQHSMLDRNIAALQLVIGLMSAQPTAATNELQSARTAIADMIGRSETALAQFSPGTSPHTLQRNRLAALQTAQLLIAQAIEPERA